MRTLLTLIVSLAFAVPSAAEPPNKKDAMPHLPTRADDTKDVLFGVTVSDPYRWLEDAKRPDVKDWMIGQDKVTREALNRLAGRQSLAERLKQLFYMDSISAPIRRGKNYFYTRTHADREKAVHYWREGEDGAEHVLLDPNKMSKDGTVSVHVVVPSWDGKKVAYTLATNNSDESTVHVMDVASGKVSAIDTIEGGKYAHPSWTPSSDGFYYTWLPPLGGKVTVADRPGFAEVRFHKLGADPKRDPVIHERTGNPESFIGPQLSRDGHWLFVYIQHGWTTVDVYWRDTRDPKAKGFRPLVVGADGQFQVEAWKDRFYVSTNDGAPRWRVFAVDPARPARREWREIVPEQKDAVLDNLQLIGGHLALTWLKHATTELELRTLDGARVRKLALPGVGSSSGFAGNPEDDVAYYSYTSFTQPLQIFRARVSSGESKLWAEVKVPVDSKPYVVEQVFYPSKDGTQVSMFVVHRKDLRRDGSTPFLLFGYGGFNVSETPVFQASLFPWLEAGGGFALPNLRGGGEYGEAWHRAGMGAKKQNVFDDFIAAAEWLTKNGYTRHEKLAIRGGSNGGLLVGAALTQRPDLFRAVVCAVPLLDMVRYHLFGSGKTWIPEYGSSADEAGFKTLFAYSPYHRVKPGTRYPSVLLLSADADDRVDPMHARKMAAALQSAQAADDRPILLRIEQHAGHGGADLVKQAVEQSADSYTFLMHELGMTPPGAAASK